MRITGVEAGVKRLQGRHPVDDVRAGAHREPIARAAHVPRGPKGIALGEQGGGDRRLPEHAPAGAGEQQAAEPRVGGQPRQLAAQRRDAIGFGAIRLHRAELPQQPPCGLERSRRGRIEPRKVRRLPDREQLQERPGKIAADRLGRLGLRTVVMGRLVPQPPADAGGGPARAARPLLGRRLRNRHEFQAGQAGGMCHPQLSRESRIDDRGDAGDRQ